MTDTNHTCLTPWVAVPCNPAAGLQVAAYVVARPGRVGIAVEDKHTGEWLAERLNELYTLRRQLASTHEAQLDREDQV